MTTPYIYKFKNDQKSLQKLTRGSLLRLLFYKPYTDNLIGNNSSHIENDFNSDATWNHSSDVRQKTDIKDDVLGLNFINDLKTRTYKHKSPSEFPQEWDAYDPDNKEPMGGDKIIHGFIAQEVKKALDETGVDTFQGWSEGNDGRQRVSFEAFVLPLIKAVQELSKKVEELENKES